MLASACGAAWSASSGSPYRAASFSSAAGPSVDARVPQLERNMARSWSRRSASLPSAAAMAAAASASASADMAGSGPADSPYRPFREGPRDSSTPLLPQPSPATTCTRTSFFAARVAEGALVERCGAVRVAETGAVAVAVVVFAVATGSLALALDADVGAESAAAAARRADRGFGLGLGASLGSGGGMFGPADASATADACTPASSARARAASTATVFRFAAAMARSALSASSMSLLILAAAAATSSSALLRSFFARARLAAADRGCAFASLAFANGARLPPICAPALASGLASLAGLGSRASAGPAFSCDCTAIVP